MINDLGVLNYSPNCRSSTYNTISVQFISFRLIAQEKDIRSLCLMLYMRRCVKILTCGSGSVMRTSPNPSIRRLCLTYTLYPQPTERISFYSNGILDEKTLEVFVECSETFANKCNSTDWFTRRMITLTAIMSSNNGFGKKEIKTTTCLRWVLLFA